ncbi:MAG: alpha/beta fold hydrolase [Ignavibacteriales bacterium]|nr:alpha/beta fold hydrolase [Ignavibacteriales bacterium]
MSTDLKVLKDWGFVPQLAKHFSESGFFVITFNFSHNGVGKSLTEFDELDKFANNTLSREVNELIEIISAYKNGFFGKIANQNKIGLVGHSRGGAVSILAASKNKNVDALVTWAAISKLDRFTERQKEEWIEKGYFEVLNTRTNQIMRLNKVFLDDLKNNSSTTLNLEKALRELAKPYLILQGDQDLAVPFVESKSNL